MSKLYGGERFETRKELARLIPELREKQNLSQGELARLVGVSRQTISNIETGKSVPQDQVLRSILEVLGVSDEQVIFEESTRTWLVTVGTLIEALPAERRQRAMIKTVNLLSDEIRRSSISALPEVAAESIAPQNSDDIDGNYHE